MSKVQMLRALVKQRLTAAAEDIFGLFERTIAEYEETLCRSKEENERQRRLLDAVFNPQLRLHRADIQQEWSPSLDQEEPPEPPHIKEEQEEVWTNQEGEQLHKLEEADITKFTFTPVPVKSEEDEEEKPQCSQLHQRQTEQMETEGDGEDCGGPEPDRNSHPERHLTPDKTGDSSETEVSDWEETREPQSGSKNVKVSDRRCKVDEKSLSCSECGKIFVCKATLKRHMITHTGEKPFRCSVCGKVYTKSYGLKRHMRTHTGEKPFGCPDCGKRFGRKEHLIIHIRIHTGERPFSCSVCQKSFSVRDTLQSHMRTHTGQKRFRCTVCDKRFVWCRQLKIHKCTESSQLHHRQTDQKETEAEGEDCGGPEPAWNSELDTHLMTELNPGELSQL